MEFSQTNNCEVLKIGDESTDRTGENQASIFNKIEGYSEWVTYLRTTP
jgi:hypothetical protein